MKTSISIIFCFIIVAAYCYFCYISAQEEKKRTKLIADNIDKYLDRKFCNNIPIKVTAVQKEKLIKKKKEVKSKIKK